MALSIKNPEADRLAREVARLTGETLTQAVITALRERLAVEQHRNEDRERLVRDAMEIGRHCAALPVYDARSPDEIIGYDEYGVPR